MPHKKTYTWFKIADDIKEINTGPGGLAEITVNGKVICIAVHNSILMACTQKCPHAGGVLSHGYLDVLGNIVCPVHRYKFSMQSGRNISGEGYFLKTFPVEVRTDGVFIGFRENKRFHW